jgi:phospholipid/cholesterol/gamma-HCH transport system substrate-binding protein
MERTTLDLWVGIFVMAGVGALVALAMKVGNLGSYNASNTYQVQAYFSNIGGLKTKASVRSAGVLVGRVVGVVLKEMPQGYQAQVTMKIDNSYQFPTDTTADILTAGLLGEQYIGLSPDGMDDTKLKDGDTIKQTSSAMVLENMIGKFLYNKAAE